MKFEDLKGQTLVQIKELNGYVKIFLGNGDAYAIYGTGGYSRIRSNFTYVARGGYQITWAEKKTRVLKDTKLLCRYKTTYFLRTTRGRIRLEIVEPFFHSSKFTQIKEGGEWIMGLVL